MNAQSSIIIIIVLLGNYVFVYFISNAPIVNIKSTRLACWGFLYNTYVYFIAYKLKKINWNNFYVDLDNTSSFVPAASTLADFENLSDSDWETDNMESITRMLNHLYFIILL